jgi:hypothetical protein
MPEPTSTVGASLAKLIGGSALGGLLVSALAVASDIPIPSELPAPHTALDMVNIGALIGMIIREIRRPKKEERSDMTKTDPGWRNTLLEKLEDLAYGSKDTVRELKDHRLDFADFRGETRGRLNAIEDRVSRVEDAMEKG